MATFDQLSAEQRAILELVLKQGRSFDQLADMLSMPVDRVRDLARDALVRLSPVSARSVDDDWRGQLADYLLNQQAGPESTATRGHLRRSEAARGWARSVLDSLDQFYEPSQIPTIPDGDPGARPRRRERRTPEKPAGPAPPPHTGPPPARAKLSSSALDQIQRRRLVAGGGAIAVVLLLIVLVWPVGLLTGGGDDGGSGGSGGGKASASKASNASSATRIVAQLALAPVEELQGSKKYAGIAAIVQSGSKRQLLVRAQLPPNAKDEAYQVWLYDSDSKVKSLGAQTANSKGVFQGAGPLPSNFEDYTYIDVSREPLNRDPDTHSGKSVLRGRVSDFAAPQQTESEGSDTTTTP